MGGSGCFAKLPDVEHSGGWLVASGARWPFPAYSIGHEDLHAEVREIHFVLVLFLPLPILRCFVLQGPTGASTVELLLAVVATGEVIVDVVRGQECAVISVSSALAGGRCAVVSALYSTHEDEGRSIGHPALADHLVLKDEATFSD